MSPSGTKPSPTDCKPTAVEPKTTTAWKVILTLVLLRLCIGWHFFSEGTQKLAYDEGRDQWRMNFTAEDFLRQAKGPLAGLFHGMLPDGHDWESLLAVTRQAKPIDSEQQYQQIDWQTDYTQRRAQAAKGKEPPPIEFPPFAPYHDWATQVVDDWRAMLKEFTDLDRLDDEQRHAAAERFQVRHQQLADYLAGESDAIRDYQHNLWRLEQKENQVGAKEIPYREQRVAVLEAETTREPRPWLTEVRSFEQGFVDDLRNIAGSDDPSLQKQVEQVVTHPAEKRIWLISLVVTITVTAVGVCLMIGLFTRLASVVGALFLLSVVATQPPWIAGAESTIYQTVELFALLVLAATAAGRWAGLDYFTHALSQKFSRKTRITS